MATLSSVLECGPRAQTTHRRRSRLSENRQGPCFEHIYRITLTTVSVQLSATGQPDRNAAALGRVATSTDSAKLNPYAVPFQPRRPSFVLMGALPPPAIASPSSSSSSSLSSLYINPTPPPTPDLAPHDDSPPDTPLTSLSSSCESFLFNDNAAPFYPLSDACAEKMHPDAKPKIG